MVNQQTFMNQIQSDIYVAIWRSRTSQLSTTGCLTVQCLFTIHPIARRTTLYQVPCLNKAGLNQLRDENKTIPLGNLTAHILHEWNNIIWKNIWLLIIFANSKIFPPSTNHTVYKFSGVETKSILNPLMMGYEFALWNIISCKRVQFQVGESISS